jgi:hypothetical protein
MQQFSTLLSWRLFTAQHVSGVFPPIIRSSMTAVSASGFTFVSWWQSCCRPAQPRTQHDCHHMRIDTVSKPDSLGAYLHPALKQAMFRAGHASCEGVWCSAWLLPHVLCAVSVYIADGKSWKVRRIPPVDAQHCILRRLYPVNQCVVLRISLHFRFLHSLPSHEHCTALCRECDCRGNILLQFELPVVPRMCKRW